MNSIRMAVHVHEELRRRILENDPALDEETLSDTLEGLTDLHEIIAEIVRFAVVDEALVWGLKSRVLELQERLGRLEERADIRRKLARDAMLEAGIKKITDPEFTISVRPGTAAILVTDEKEIPEQFWKPRDPRLDRVGLLAALKQGAVVPGAALCNPEPVLMVRSK